MHTDVVPGASGVADVISKGAFANLCGVTPGRVSQWIAEGKIETSALEGEGRSARIKVALAQSQLRRHLDISQRLGNGITTNLGTEAEEVPSDEALPPRSNPLAAPPREPSVEDKIKAERLRQIEAQNRRLLEEERDRAGLYVRADDSRAEIGRAAAMMLKIFEGGLADLANDLAGRFELPQRDLLHALRSKFRDVRANAARALKDTIETLPAYIEDADGSENDGNPSGESVPPHGGGIE